jgi:transcriptional regulator with XRE-family HTH domain
MKVKEKDDAFASRVKAIRKEVRLLQEEFCKKLNISSTQLSKIENGKNKPGHGFYVNIVREFDVNLEYLLLGEGPMFRTGKTKKEAASTGYDRIPGYKSTGEIDEFLYYFFNSDYFRYKVMAEAVRTRNEFEKIIKNEIALHKPRDRK